MYTEALWQSWSGNEANNYKSVNGKKVYEKKGYTHFDFRFWFPDKKEELKEILKAGLKVFKVKLQRTEYWSFKPFLKILLKTPRYRYEEELGYYELQDKIRPICFASHVDSLIFGFYAHCLSKVYEKYIVDHAFSECVLAYRTDLQLSNIQFAKQSFEQIRSRGSCTAIALDIKGYFDNIDHQILKDKWSTVIGGKLPVDQFRIYKALTEYSYVSKDSFYRSFRGKRKRNVKEPPSLLSLIPGKNDFEKFQVIRDKRLVVKNKYGKGIPQGSSMSALLSNIFLIDFDQDMSDKAAKEGFIYKRYCDDILLICDTEKSNGLLQFTIKKIADEYKLKIQKEKAEVVDFRPNSKNLIRAFRRKANNPFIPVMTTPQTEKIFYRSLQYLGFEFNGQDIFIRSSSLSRYHRKTKARIRKTISMAYSPRSRSQRIFKKQLFEKYSHLGSRNFFTYAYKASSEFYLNAKGDKRIGMNSPAIRKQLSRHIDLAISAVRSKSIQRMELKKRRGDLAVKLKA